MISISHQSNIRVGYLNSAYKARGREFRRLPTAVLMRRNSSSCDAAESQVQHSLTYTTQYQTTCKMQAKRKLNAPQADG